MPHKCETHTDWLLNNHYFCSCGHVEWAHHTNGSCAHCNCKQYDGEARPLTVFEKLNLLHPEQKPSLDEFKKKWTNG